MTDSVLCEEKRPKLAAVQRAGANGRNFSASAAPVWLEVLETSLVAVALLFLFAIVRYHFTTSANLRDFETFYDSAAAWLAGRPMYAAGYPNMNPPLMTVLFSPLTVLPKKEALAVWLVVGLVAALAAAGIALAETGSSITRRRLIVALGFAGTNAQLMLGQVAWLLMLPATLGWRAYRNRDDVSAVIWWGVVLAMKPIFGPLTLLLLLRRRYRLLAALSVSGASLCAAGWAFTGLAAYREWIAAGNRVTWFDLPLNASMFGVISRLHLPPTLVPVLWIVAALSILALTVLRCRRPDSDSEIASYLLASLLIAPLGWIYYLSVALGPLIVLSRELRWPRWSLAPLALLFWPPGAVAEQMSDYARGIPMTAAQSVVACFYFLGLLSLWWVVSSDRHRGPAAAVAALE